MLVGAGIGGAVRLTREAEEAIRTASVVLHMTAIGAELERLCPDGLVVSLMPTYEAGDDPDEVYGRIADRLVAEAELAHGRGGTAAFVTYGHPLWLVTSARSALRRCAERGLRASVVPGISSIDTMLVDSPVPLDRGAQLYEAGQFVRQGLGVERRLPLVLFQFGDFGSGSLRPDHTATGRFGAILERLAGLYPAGHPVHIVLSPWREGMRPRVVSSTVADLAGVLEAAHVGTTLVVAPLPAGD